MADEAAKPSVLDQLLSNASRLGDVYQKVRLADKGVAVPTVVYETNGATDPLVKAGQPAAVKGDDPLASAFKSVAMGYTAKQLSDSMPYIMGMTAAVIAIYMLTRKG